MSELLDELNHYMSYMVTGLHGYMVARMVLLGCLLTAETGRAAEPRIIYENNFQKSAVGKLPEEFLVLDGAFSIKEQDGNKFIELPGAPLDSFGVLFGPTENGGSSIAARVY